MISSKLNSPMQQRHNSKLLAGLRFGLLLQFAIGPVCMFVLQTGAEHGILSGLLVVAAVVIVDAAYISLAVLGVTQWSNGRRVRTVLQWAGALVIASFGLEILFAACLAKGMQSPIGLARGAPSSSPNSEPCTHGASLQSRTSVWTRTALTPREFRGTNGS